MRPELEPFATTLRQEGIPLRQTEQAAEAVLTTLAERISAGEARDLAARSPTRWKNVSALMSGKNRPSAAAISGA